MWMEDYETGEGLSEEEVFTNLAMFVDRDPVLFASVVKCDKWRAAMDAEIEAIEKNSN